MFLRAAVAGLVLLMASYTGARAQDAAAAERFVRNVYSHYRAGAAPFMPVFERAPSIFTPEVVALIRKEQEESEGEAGKLDIDPLCMCQDFEDIRIATLTFTPVQNNRTTATAELADGAHRFTMKIQLMAVRNAWRIDDLQEGDEPSLRQLLN